VSLLALLSEPLRRKTHSHGRFAALGATGDRGRRSAAEAPNDEVSWRGVETDPTHAA